MDRAIFLLNGPNLNLLGIREPDLYGTASLADIERDLAERARAHGFALDARQTNHEGILVDWVQDARDKAAAIILNAGGLTHSSVSLRDALLTVAVPVVEVHLTNVHAREPFRRRSLIADVVTGSITGLGALGYGLALDAAVRLCKGAATQAPPGGADR